MASTISGDAGKVLSERKSVVTVTILSVRRILLVVLLVTTVAQAQTRRRSAGVSPAPEATRAQIIAIVNRVLTAYEHADFSVAWKKMDDDPTAAANPLYIVIPIARASALTVKYENEQRDPELIVTALEQLEFAIDRHEQWGHSWVTASVVNLFDLTVHRMREYDDLPPQVRNRVEILWQRALEMTRFEADVRLVWNMPVPPYDSSTRGDTQAEEFAWEASLLTAAAVFLPEHPNAPVWERKGRQLAYDAITRPSDPPDIEGIKTTTVTEEWTLSNHDIEGNPYYTIATLQLLQEAELPYRMTGGVPPAELDHNFAALYRVYESYIARDENGAFVWNRASDAGDPSLIPLGKAGNPTLDYLFARQRASSHTLWSEAVTSGVIPESDLFAAIQNHKVALYQIVGLYWWYWPRVSSR
jgi:hypothetical protein